MNGTVARRIGLKGALAILAVTGAAGVLYVFGAAVAKPSEPARLNDLKRGPLAKLQLPKGAPAAQTTQGFTDAAGKPVKLADFKGQIVVLNFWATWCGPCKTEMPTLARLQAAYSQQPVKVLAVSVDRIGDLDVARADIAKLPPLKLYNDPGYKLTFAISPRVEGFPTTIILDRKGVERARLSGGADWASPESRQLIDRLLKEQD